MKISVGYAFQGPRRVPDHRHASSDVACDDRTGTDNRTVTHCHARKQNRSAADPNVATDCHGFCDLNALGTRHRVEMVFRTVNLHRRPQHRAVAYRYLSGIENGAARVEIYILSQRDIKAVSAMKRRFEKRAFPDRINSARSSGAIAPRSSGGIVLCWWTAPRARRRNISSSPSMQLYHSPAAIFSRSVDIVSPSKGIDKMLRQTSRQNGDDIEAQ